MILTNVLVIISGIFLFLVFCLIIFLFYRLVQIIKQRNANENFEENDKKEDDVNDELRKLDLFIDRMKNKRSDYLEDLQENDNIQDNMSEENADDDEIYIYNLRNQKNIGEKILVISKDDMLFKGNVVENMDLAENVLRRVSRLYDIAKRSREIVIDELEKPIKSLKLQIKSLLDDLSDLDFKKIKITNVESIVEFKVNYSTWISSILRILNDINKSNFMEYDSSNIEEAVKSMKPFGGKSENDNDNDNDDKSIEEFIPDRSNNDDIGNVKKKEEQSGNEKKVKLSEFKDRLSDIIETNSESVEPLERFFDIWEDYIDKAEFIKKGLDEMLEILGSVDKDFSKTYDAFIDFLPLIERYFESNIQDIINKYDYPNIEKIKSTNVPMSNFEDIENLSKEDKVYAEPYQIQNIQKYVNRALKNLKQLLEKDSSKIRAKVVRVKSAYVDGVPMTFSNSRRGNGGYGYLFYFFQKSYFDQVKNVKEKISKIHDDLIAYIEDLKRMVELSNEKEDIVNTFEDVVLEMKDSVVNLNGELNDLKKKIENDGEKKEDDGKKQKISDEEWENISSKINSVKNELKQNAEIQDNITDLKNKISDILGGLDMNIEIKDMLENLAKDFDRIEEVYLELPDEFRDFENNIDLYETNSLRAYDASAFIFIAIESLFHPMIEDILELDIVKDNKLFKDFFNQSKVYFEQ